MTEPLDLVVCSLEDWDEIWRRNQYLVAGLLRADPGLRVLFVEPPADPVHAASSGWLPKAGRGLRTVFDLPGVGPGRLWRYQPTKWLPRRIGGDVDGRIARGLIRVTDRLGLRNPVLWINSPSMVAVLHATGWAGMYDMTDDWLAADRHDRQLDKLETDEAALMRECAEVVVCSPGLQRTKSAVRPVTLIQNAVDVERFRAPTARPIDLPTGRQAVYVGTIHRDRIDIDLCAATARALAERMVGGITLVGPAAISDVDRQLLTSAGVTLLGARPHVAVPGYLQHADALVVPHVIDGFTDSLDPIKLYEYQAVGRPVISTPVAGFRDYVSGQLTLASGAEFVEAVVATLTAEKLPPGPIGDGSGVPAWQQRVTEMRAVIDRVAARRTDQSRS